jgi:hypothetical protein
MTVEIIFLNCIKELTDSNLDWDTDYTRFSSFSSVLSEKYWVSTYTTTSFHTFPNTTFINHPTIRRHILWATDSVGEHPY